MCIQGKICKESFMYWYWKFYIHDNVSDVCFLKVLTYCIAVIFKQPKGFTLITETRVFIEGVTMFILFLCPKGMPEITSMNKWQAQVYNNGLDRAAEVLKIKLKQIFKMNCFILINNS